MFKIDSEKELVSFLKILAQESVKDSKHRLKESSDDLASSFSDRLNKEKQSLYEVEDDEEAEDDSEPVETQPEESPEAEQSEPEEEKESQSDATNIEASFDVLKRRINTLRAGKSLKDSSVKKELEVYYDKLSAEERNVLVLFMRELGDILGGESGADAVDPSGPPLNINFVVSGDDPKKDEPSPEEPPEEEALPEDEEEVEEEAEDTAPPIKVNESQDIIAIRNKIRKLMRS